MIKPLVSIIIATYNEEKNIKTLLESCSDQNYKDLEILVVDSTRTTDKTSHIAKNFGVKVYKFGAERSVQRNYGVKRGSICLIDLRDQTPNSKVTLPPKTGPLAIRK